MSQHTHVAYTGLRFHSALREEPLPLVTKTVDDIPPDYFRPDLRGGFDWGCMSLKAYRLAHALLADVLGSPVPQDLVDRFLVSVVGSMPEAWRLRADAIDAWSEEKGASGIVHTMEGFEALKAPEPWKHIPPGGFPFEWVRDEGSPW